MKVKTTAQHSGSTWLQRLGLASAVVVCFLAASTASTASVNERSSSRAADASQGEDGADARHLEATASRYAYTNGRGVIRLREAARCEGVEIRLADLADISGAGAEAVAELIIARFEADQQKRDVRVQLVRDRLSAVNVNWGLVTLAGYSTCEASRRDEVNRPRLAEEPAPLISNPSESIDAQTPITVRDRVMAVVKQMCTGLAGEVAITVGEDQRDVLDLSLFGDRYEVEPLTDSVPGRMPVAIRRYRGTTLVETYRVHVDVVQRTLAVTASKPIRRGEALGPDNLVVKQVELTSAGSAVVSSMEDAVGQVSAGYISEGAVLYRSQVRPPTVIRRGQLVTVRCMIGSIVVRTAGRAMDEGAVGDVIRVRNERSRETFTVRVNGPGETVVVVREGEASPTSENRSRMQSDRREGMSQ